MKNAAATRNVTSAAFRRTKLVRGSAIATSAPTTSTAKIGMRIMSTPRIQRPRYIWPRPGSRRDRTAAKPGEPLTAGAESARTRGEAADDAPRFDTERLAYETRRSLDGAPASD